MIKFLLFVFLLADVRRVSCFKCYVTEIEHSSVNGLLNKTHKEKNCLEQRKDILPVPISLPKDGKGISCFKITATDSRGFQLDIKGCIPSGECEQVKNDVVNNAKVHQSGRFLPEDAKCYECETEMCNAAWKVGGAFWVILIVGVLYA